MMLRILWVFPLFGNNGSNPCILEINVLCLTDPNPIRKEIISLPRILKVCEIQDFELPFVCKNRCSFCSASAARLARPTVQNYSAF